MAILATTLIGVSELGAVRGPSAQNGARIMAVPQWPAGASPFLGFGAAPPAVATPVTTTPVTTTPVTTTPITTTPVTTTPVTTTPGGQASEATKPSRPGSAAGAASVHQPARPGREQGVTVVSAVLNTPSTRSAVRTPPVRVVAVVSTQDASGASSVTSITPAAMFVDAASAYPVVTAASSRRRLTPPAPERADGTSQDRAKRGHATKAGKHARARRDAKAAQLTRNI
ncbi:MAG: hypothetical protein ABI662_02475 [Dermatophilaceae bacterium]